MTRCAEVVGDPIAQSLSPLIHGYWLEALGITARYDRRLVARGGVAAYLAERRADRDWCGCNVTMPLKLEALRAADIADDRALAAGAANLITVKDGQLHAANTDVGAIAVLVERVAQPGQRVTLLGNGGAARAALVALVALGLRDVCIHSRDRGEAIKLAVEFGLSVEPGALGDPVTSDGLVNATPLGMTGQPVLAIDLGAMPAGGWVFDMVTDPAETALVGAARAHGLATIIGLDMLVEQAATSFSALFGVDPPRDRDAGLWNILRP